MDDSLGRLNAGESPLVAAQRETREEAGIESEVTGLLALQDLPFAQEGWFALIFLARHVKGTPTGDGRETDAARYFSESELDALGEPVEPLSDWLVRRVFHNRLTVIPGNRENPFSPQHGFF